MMSNNKKLVAAIVSMSILGLVTMMFVMFKGIEIFVDKKDVTPTVAATSPTTVEDTFDFESNLNGVIISKDDEELWLYNLSNGDQVRIVVSQTTEIVDRYLKTIPFSSISVGEVVEIFYKPESRIATVIAVHADSWERAGVSGQNFNTETRILTLGDATYKLSSPQVILNEYNEVITTLENISNYDTLLVKGIGEQIYSIQVTTQAGAIQISNLPNSNGRIEIDRQRQILLSDLAQNELIELTSGVHHIALYVDGYQTLVQDGVQIDSGQTYTLNAANLKLQEYSVGIRLSTGGASYTLTINDKEYRSGQTAMLPTGEYDLKVIADGYETYTQTFRVSDNMILQPTLVALPTGTTVAVEETPLPSSYSIRFNTIPEGAKVFIDGEYVGVTPATKSLGLGIYKVELELEGYERYSTSIIIEHEDVQLDYLYVLTPN
ncbi:MAG: hypothetical protein ATN35_04390 [Epulopiscium sp. Nele67-Bin004]|nr:MAG: hypothetical protein ATN35_04390 [Epulopiscium sp. Nele67-Bin004]